MIKYIENLELELKNPETNGSRQFEIIRQLKDEFESCRCISEAYNLRITNLTEEGKECDSCDEYAEIANNEDVIMNHIKDIFHDLGLLLIK